MTVFAIYKFTNLQSGKVYIGKTQQAPEKRKNSHFYDVANGSNTIFHCALRSYGIEQFSFEVICCTLHEDDANYLEKQLISEYQATNRSYGYNMTPGGDGVSSEVASNTNYARVANGTNAWAGEKGTALNASRIKAGTHNFHGVSGSEFAKKNAAKLISAGNHASQKKYHCPHCQRDGKGGGMKAKHFDNCKMKPS